MRPGLGGTAGEAADDDSRARIHTITHRITAEGMDQWGGELVIPDQTVDACRDPKDNKFLEAALAGEADCIVSGDADLLDMGSFEEIPILRPAEFLAQCP